MTKCPSCWKEMEKGYSGAETNEFALPAWFKKKSALRLGREALAPLNFNLSYFQGIRCTSCRVMLLKY
ncbi:MAG: PF20097 family protein [Thermoplasmata archaeon]